MTTFSKILSASTLLLAPFIGSFLGTLIVRLPEGRPVVLDRSRCDACGEVLGARDLVPIFSWLLLKGRREDALRVLIRIRGRGPGPRGRAMAEECFAIALGIGVEKLVASMTVDQQAAIAVFEELGFRPEAMLSEHVRDRDGNKHDVALLSHDVNRFLARLETFGQSAPG